MHNTPIKPDEDPDRILTEKVRSSRKLLEFVKSKPAQSPPKPLANQTMVEPEEPRSHQTIQPVSDFSISDFGISDTGISVSYNYTRMDNDIFDILPEKISREAWRVYIRLYRISWGFHNNVCSVSYSRLEQALSAQRSTVQSSISELRGNGNSYISIIKSDKQNSNTYRVRLPVECHSYPSRTTVESRVKSDGKSKRVPVSDFGISDFGISDTGILFVGNNSTKVDNDIIDILLRILPKAEWYVYIHMYRLSWGYGSNTCQTSLHNLEMVTKASKTVIREALAGLKERKYISIIDKNRAGSVYRIWLPCEVDNYDSKTVISQTDKHSIPKSDMSKSDISDISQEVSDFGISDFGPFKEYYSIKQYSKNTLLASLVLEFYQALGQTRISKDKQKKGERDCEFLFKDGYTEKEIQTAITWAIKHIPDVHSFGIIPAIIGQALTKSDRIETHHKKDQNPNEAEIAKRTQWEEAAVTVDEMDEETRAILREEAWQRLAPEVRQLAKGPLEKMLYSVSVDIVMGRKEQKNGVA